MVLASIGAVLFFLPDRECRLRRSSSFLRHCSGDSVGQVLSSIFHLLEDPRLSTGSSDIPQDYKE